MVHIVSMLSLWADQSMIVVNDWLINCVLKDTEELERQKENKEGHLYMLKDPKLLKEWICNKLLVLLF